MSLVRQHFATVAISRTESTPSTVELGVQRLMISDTQNDNPAPTSSQHLRRRRILRLHPSPISPPSPTYPQMVPLHRNAADMVPAPILRSLTNPPTDSPETRDSTEALAGELAPELLELLSPEDREIIPQMLADSDDPHERSFVIRQLRSTLLHRQKMRDHAKKILDTIPLVLYIPVPDNDTSSPIASPTSARWQRWEDKWEKSELPYVRLEEHRAGCLICLMDFDEPRRRDDLLEELQDQQESPEPLRQLPCNHVFHKSCIDTWIIEASRDCPYCRQKILFHNEPEPEPREVESVIMQDDSSMFPWTERRSIWYRIKRRARKALWRVARIFRR